MIRFLYNLLFPVALLFFLPGYAAKMVRRGNYRSKFGQRFGLYSNEVVLRLRSRRNTWIHAVSVGEVAVALKLAAQLKNEEPDFNCVLTTTTTTGHAFAAKNAPEWMEVMYTPLDFWPITRCAFRTIQPRRLILVEAEVWPNMVGEAHHRSVPVALVNARLSQRSEHRFHRAGWIVAPMFRLLDAVGVPQEADAERWSRLGVPPARISVTGNVKYDVDGSVVDENLPRQVLGRLGIDSARPVLLGGSTHPGEEDILAEVFLQLRADFPSLFLIIAPRHVERCPQIRRQLEKMPLRVALSSDSVAPADPADLLLLDATGELRHWYSAGTVVFVGKSLSAQGGQNPVEPVVAGKPVIFGPNMQNFSTLSQSLLANGGAIEVQDATSLRSAITKLLRDPVSRETLVVNAKAVLAAHHGATARTVALVRNARVAQAAL